MNPDDPVSNWNDYKEKNGHLNYEDHDLSSGYLGFMTSGGAKRT